MLDRSGCSVGLHGAVDCAEKAISSWEGYVYVLGSFSPFKVTWWWWLLPITCFLFPVSWRKWSLSRMTACIWLLRSMSLMIRWEWPVHPYQQQPIIQSLLLTLLLTHSPTLGFIAVLTLGTYSLLGTTVHPPALPAFLSASAIPEALRMLPPRAVSVYPGWSLLTITYPTHTCEAERYTRPLISTF